MISRSTLKIAVSTAAKSGRLESDATEAAATDGAVGAIAPDNVDDVEKGGPNVRAHIVAGRIV